jgi:hypothetical protein
MRRAPKILPAVAASAAMVALSASGAIGSSGAAACQIPALMTVEMPNASEAAAPRATRAVPARQLRSDRPKRDAPVRPATGKMNCGACIGLMPAFESEGLMPLVPVAEPFRIHVIDAPANNDPAPSGQ